MQSSPVPQQQRRLQVTPRGAPPAGQVTVKLTGMPPLTGLRIGFGSLQEHQFIGRTASDAEGNATETVRIPDWAQRDKVHYFFMAYDDMQPRGFSDAFHVTGPDGMARVSGVIGDEGGSCSPLRNASDDLYTLIGDTREFKAGSRVVVRGRVVEGAPCGDLGIAIAVTEIRSAL